MDPREISWGGVEWIHLAQDRDSFWAVVSAVMNLRVLAPRSLFLTAVETVSVGLLRCNAMWSFR
jgi:hypothetical protein